MSRREKDANEDADRDERDDKAATPGVRRVRSDGRVIVRKTFNVPEDVIKAMAHLGVDQDHTESEQWALAAIQMVNSDPSYDGAPLLPPWQGPASPGPAKRSK